MPELETIDPEKFQITPEIKRKAQVIALFMGGDYNMTVGVGPWGSGWNWDFVKNHVNIDPKSLATEPEDVVKGVAAHEGFHRLGSRAEHVMPFWQEPGFSFGFNAVDDPRANQTGMHFNPGTKDWIQAYIERGLGPDGGLDYEGMEKNARSKLGYVPNFMKWGAEIIRFWYQNEFEGKISDEDKKKYIARVPDKKVRETVEKTVDFFKEYYKTVPDSKSEMDIQLAAKKAALNFIDNIWPIYKELVDKSYQDHSMVKMLEDMEQQQSQGQGQQGQGQSKSGSSSLPSEIKKEIEKGRKDSKEQSSKQKGSDGKGPEKESEPKEDKKNEEGQGAGKIPWDKLSDKSKEKIKEMFDSLPKDKQEEYKEKAKEDLENAEDEANEKLRGKMNDPRYTKTHKEQREEDTQEEQKSQEAKDAQEIIERMRKKIEKTLDDIPENPYSFFLNLPEVDAIRRRMERDFKRIFEPTEDRDVRYSSFGMKPSVRKAMQSEADPRITNIMESKGRPTEKKYRFYIMVDLSGSMRGKKIEETFKALIPIVENLNRFGIEFQIVGFTDNLGPEVIKIYKPFEVKKLTTQSRNDMGKIMKEGGGNTPTSEATKISVKLLKKRMAEVNIMHNYFITLTDGLPNEGFDELLKLIKQVRKDKSFVTAGFGIGPNTEFVNQSYPVLPEEIKSAIARELGSGPGDVDCSFASAEEFGRAFAIIISYMIKRPELFFR